MTNVPVNKPPGYEKSDISLRKTVVVAVAIVVVAVIAVVVLSEYYLSVRGENVYEMTLKPESTFLRDLRAQEDEILSSYKLIDSAHGIYRVPISRAMELLAEDAYRAQSAR